MLRETRPDLRLVTLPETIADIRVFLRISDSHPGDIAWEGHQEMSLSNDTSTEEGVTFQDMVREVART